MQAINEAYEAVKKFKIEEMKKSKGTEGAKDFEDEESSEVHLSVFGPSEGDNILAGDDEIFQSRKNDIYKALRTGFVQ